MWNLTLAAFDEQYLLDVAPGQAVWVPCSDEERMVTLDGCQQARLAGIVLPRPAADVHTWLGRGRLFTLHLPAATPSPTRHSLSPAPIALR